MQMQSENAVVQGGLRGASMNFVRAYQDHPAKYSEAAQAAFSEKLLECGDWRVALEATRNFPVAGDVA